MSFLAGVLVVLRKEIMDGKRDKRSIRSVIFSALIGPVMLGFLFNNLASEQRNAREIKVPVVGAQYAPAFIDWLNQQSGVEVITGPADPEKAVRDRKEDVVVVIDKEFTEKMAHSIPAPIKVVSDETRNSARPKVRRVRRLIEVYSGEIGALRMVARGVSPSVATPLRVEEVEVSSAQQRAATILSVLPLFLVLAALVGGLQLAIDSTAGERERGSLEPLLLNPVPRETFVVGKWLAASLFGSASVLLSTGLCMTVFRRVPWQDLGVRFNVGPPELAGLLALVLPLAFLLSAMVMFVSMFARSFKEAQSYIGLLTLLPMLPAILQQVFPLAGRPWLAPAPFIGQYALAADLLGGKPPAVYLYVIAGACVLGLALVLVMLTARMLRREQIIFGR
jgi:sodium transport system permease protein